MPTLKKNGVYGGSAKTACVAIPPSQCAALASSALAIYAIFFFPSRLCCYCVRCKMPKGFCSLLVRIVCVFRMCRLLVHAPDFSLFVSIARFIAATPKAKKCKVWGKTAKAPYLAFLACAYSKGVGVKGIFKNRNG